MTGRLWPGVPEALHRMNAPLEGRFASMYLDRLGLVTTGVGNLIDPIDRALALPWRRPDGSLASPAEVERDWWRLKESPDAARLGARWAERLTSVRLTEADIDALVDKRLRANVVDLAQRFPELPRWPASAQVAVLSMAWAMGSGFWRKFPRCSAALDARDFATAALEAHIDEPGDKAIERRNRENRRLLLWAARVQREGLPPGDLYLGDPEAAPAPEAPPAEGPVAGASEAHASAVQLLDQGIDDEIERARRGRE